MIKVRTDLHIHTTASTHAYSTLSDYVSRAKEMGLEAIAITDHATYMPGSPEEYYFFNMKVIPRRIGGVFVFRGIEANMIDYDGNIDINLKHERLLDLVIGSFHNNILPSISPRENTKAYISMIKQNKVDLIGHSANINAPIDVDEFLRACSDHNVAVELNNTTLKNGNRLGSEHIVMEMIEKAHKYGNKLMINSDAHIHYDLGAYDETYALIKQLEYFDEKLIVNRDFESVRDFLRSRGKFKNE